MEIIITGQSGSVSGSGISAGTYNNDYSFNWPIIFDRLTYQPCLQGRIDSLIMHGMKFYCTVARGPQLHVVGVVLKQHVMLQNGSGNFVIISSVTQQGRI